MANFIDRRLNAKGKSTVNRQRFINRYKQQIKKAVSDAVTRRSVTDVDKGEKISIPTRDISEPMFHQGKGGVRDRVHPGNDQFTRGDKIDRPPGGSGGGSGKGEASNSGEGDDDFVFEISKDEYLELLFEDLELPNLQKNRLNKLVEYQIYRAGFTNDGVPANINIVRSLRSSLARRIAMSASKKKLLKELEQELAEFENIPGTKAELILDLKAQIEELKQKIARVPFIDTFDLRFNNYSKREIPSSQAVMFCLMDVSGSMDQATKDMAKRFYILLYLFLTRTYKNLEVVYIRHHTQAKEVDEHEFFYSQETGGTIVSSALKLMHEIQQARYPADEWNIYAAQASDGDNWADDSPTCRQLLEQKILPLVRYYSYIEITNRAHQTLWREYESLQQHYDNIAVQHIRQAEDIYPVFRELFKKQAV
ncbi:YeaH/YhbH family protein [Shewanella baltica]|uniref:YeaH/YhbH family protein n=1 Tax=Shewanella baltica TaxID=62322 RepID=UPI00217E2A97|nr:YeaH/YhbH family protein [Shewanella baltica]MCS6126760.1 YeaH/YhbH family protein [Shewanella baltica]MCS6138833.1 YeaH/YhbH family protein [Shewanella baltica]MCS6145022.1 YeaH/YhbH family protein [Shewanella baltica]MCS6169552.1 YeaH/YhbH family protein [Shewanella baltica]MCS6186776.1 YeaH/YhbH family protein [Shewanella baltica]